MCFASLSIAAQRTDVTVTARIAARHSSLHYKPCGILAVRSCYVLHWQAVGSAVSELHCITCAPQVGMQPVSVCLGLYPQRHTDNLVDQHSGRQGQAPFPPANCLGHYHRARFHSWIGFKHLKNSSRRRTSSSQKKSCPASATICLFSACHDDLGVHAWPARIKV